MLGGTYCYRYLETQAGADNGYFTRHEVYRENVLYFIQEIV